MSKKALFKRDLTIVIVIVSLFIILELLHTSWFCPFFDGLGIPDPGCGFTSATKAILRGDLSAAYYHHPLVFLSPFVIFYYGYTRYYLKSIPKYDKQVVVIVIALFIIVYVLRLFGLIDHSATLVLNPNALLPRFINMIFK